jgi:molybdate transport system substrate-binding protein
MTHATPVAVISTTALKTTLDVLIPQLEQRTGYQFSFDFGPSARVARWAAEGRAADVVIGLRPRLDELVAMGKVVAGSCIDVGRSIVAVAIREGAPAPDISTAPKFREFLLQAKSIAMSNPVGSGASGAHLHKILEQLGIAEAVRDKTIYGPGGAAGLIGYFVQRGESDVGVQQYSELLAVPGIQIVGPLPDEIQETTTIAVGQHMRANVPGAARLLSDLLLSPAAKQVLREKGLDPV